ncbi:MAG: hypothetical protein ACO2PN_14435 [Pyrobaculum sp.]|jgi:hypothetical protein
MASKEEKIVEELKKLNENMERLVYNIERLVLLLERVHREKIRKAIKEELK